jgi:hypothetical protein
MEQFETDDEFLNILALSSMIHILILILIIYKMKYICGLDIIEKLLLFSSYILFSLIHYCGSLAVLSGNQTSNVMLMENIISHHQCSTIIATAETEAIKRGGWDTDRHKSYPTTDLSVYSIHQTIDVLDKTYDFVKWINKSLVEESIFPKMSSFFDIPIESLHMKDLFIVKYDEKGQSSLPIHRDSSQLTFNIALSTHHVDFEGGGTKFVISEDVVNIPLGSMLAHEGGVYHAGHVDHKGNSPLHYACEIKSFKLFKALTIIYN